MQQVQVQNNRQVAQRPMNTPEAGIKSLLSQIDIKAKFQEMLGARTPAFISSIISVVNSNDSLAKCDPMSIVGAAATAAAMDLPINSALGYAHIVPYWDRKSGKQLAQFQLGWKGLIQLAQRSGQYKILNRGVIYEGQLKENDLLTGEIKLNGEKISDNVIGYFFHFETINGFKKTTYITKENCLAHAKKYSDVFKKYGKGPWAENFEAMALKTVVKQGLSQWGMLSIELQKAMVVDQAVIQDVDAEKVVYIDNQSDDRVELAPVQQEEEAPTPINPAPVKTFTQKVEAAQTNRKPEIPFGAFVAQFQTAGVNQADLMKYLGIGSEASFTHDHCELLKHAWIEIQSGAAKEEYFN